MSKALDWNPETKAEQNSCASSQSSSNKLERVIIIGGGFAGVKCARVLKKLLPAGSHKIVLFNRENHMVFSPLLAEVASAAIKTKDVAAPLRQLLRGVTCRSEDVINIDLESSYIEYEAYDSTRRKMPYAHLIIACGNTSNMAVVPGMDEHSFPLKSVGDALHLQAHVIDQMERAEVCEDAQHKERLLTFIVIGGGFSGVEVAGELNELVRTSCRYFENIEPDMIKIHLVHSRPQILPEVSPTLREFAKTEMTRRGICFHLEKRAVRATGAGVYLDDNTFIAGTTVVCTIGTTPLPIISRLPAKMERGRVITNPDMSIPGFNNAWCIGDCAAVPNEVTGTYSAPTGQFAERQGFQVAKNVWRSIRQLPTKPFCHKSIGQLCAIGGFSAVGEIGNFRISGFPAWFLWRTVYLLKLPSWTQRVKVAIEWTCDLLFPRDIAYVKTDRSLSARRAFYADGDYIFYQGDPACDFYTIERGSAEVLLRDDKTGEEELIAVLGPGDFFGEGALMDDRPRSASVRARDNLQVVVIARGLFAEISKNLTPLKDALADAMRRRRNIWSEMPEIQRILDELPLSRIIEEVPGEILLENELAVGILDQFRRHRLDFCCVVGECQDLRGVVSRSDLLRAIEIATALKGEEDEILRVHHLMSHDPISIPISESTKFAVSTMREHGLKYLPIVQDSTSRKLVGCIRIETILGHIVHELSKKDAIRITTTDMINPFAREAAER